MAPTNTKRILHVFGLLPRACVTALLIPFSVLAAAETLPCSDAHRQIEQTIKILRSLEQHQQQRQQDVRAIYQNLLACQAGGGLSFAEKQDCTQLQEEGPKQFQAMVEAITFNQQASQQLARQTRQAQLTCPANTENTLPKTPNLLLPQKSSMAK